MMRPLLAAVLLLLPGLAGAIPAAESFALRAAPPRARQYGLWELDFDCSGVPPFDPRRRRLAAEITPPSGEAYRVPAHWTRAYAVRRTAVPPTPEPGTPPWQSHRETLRPTVPGEAAAHWRVRLSPLQQGEHRVRLLLIRTAADGTEAPRRLWQGRFRAGAPAAEAKRGFLRARTPGADGRLHHRQYLRFDDGSGWFALGFNVCWPPGDSGLTGYTHYLDRLAANGCTYTRLWLCTWGLRLETETPYRYDLAEAWQLEAVLRAAQERGIYVMLCLENFHDFRHSPEKLPYFAPRGPCEKAADFFTDPEARALFRAKLRYLVARYGAFRSLLAWEFWNEMDYALEYWSDPEDPVYLSEAELAERFYLPWTRAMTASLRGLDPYRHPVTTSLGNNEVYDRLWAQPGLDLPQLHRYIRPLADLREPAEEDAAALALHSRSRLRGTGKATLLSEFGYSGTNEYNPLNDQDREGIALHNALWASALSGHAGTAMIWWWDYYLERYDLYPHYAALARFLEGAEWARPKQTLVSEEDPEVRVVVLRDERWAAVWVHNRAHTWQRRLEEDARPPELDDVTVLLSGFPRGRWRVEWLDTWDGTSLAETFVPAAEGRLELAVPAFRRDVAARLFLQEDTAAD